MGLVSVESVVILTGLNPSNMRQMGEELYL